MYVSPKRFKKMGLGISLTGVPEHEIREQLAMASAAVDSFCNVPLLPQRHSFKGGSVVGEQQGWTDHYKRRVYPRHYPIKAVSSVRIDATNNLYVDFNPNDYYVNVVEGYVELINFALTKVGIWGNAGVPALGLSQPVAILNYTYGYTFPVVDEELIALPAESGEEDWTEYMAFNGYWDRTADVTVKKNDQPLATNEYEVDHDSGFVTLNTAAVANDKITASYTYTLPWEIARATALAAVSFIGESRLVAKGMTGIESIAVEEVSLRRIGSRSGAEKGVELPAAAQSLLGGYVFMTVR